MTATEFLNYVQEQNIELDEVDSRRIKDALGVVMNLLKVRGISLNRTEQEKLVQSLAQALKQR